jgi:hypothetical protein
MDPARRRFLLACVAVLILTGLFAWRKDRSLDLGFHIATGRYILQTGHWPRLDPFTYTVSDHPYVAMGGLFQIAVALADRAAGSVGTALVREILLLAAVVILLAHARRRGVRSPTLLLLGSTLGILVWEARFVIRPELVTYGMLAAFLYLLRRYSEDRRRRWILALAPLQLIWTWSHTLSLFGPLVVGLHAATTLVGRHRRDPIPWIGLLLCMVAMVANPYGIGGIRFLWSLQTRMSASNPFAQTIGELISPFAMPSPVPAAVRWFVGMAVASAIAIGVRYRSFSLFDFATAVVFTLLAVREVRNLGAFVVVLLPLFLAAGQEIIDWFERRGWSPFSARARHAPLIAGSAAIGLICFLVVSGGYYRHSGGGFDIFGCGPSPTVYPIRCVDRIVRDGLKGPIYNHLNFGGYILGRLWPAEKVFIDGRLEVIGEDLFRAQIAVERGDAWRPMVRRYDPGIAIVEMRNFPLIRRIHQDPEWAFVDVDAAGVLFIRRRPENESVIRRAGEEWRSLNAPLPDGDGAMMPGPRPSWLRRWAAPRPTPWEPTSRGIVFESLGMYDAALREFRDAIVAGGGENPVLIESVGAVCAVLGRTKEAKAWYRRLLEIKPGDESALAALSRL